MRRVHKITLTVFAKPEEDVEATRQGIIALVPFDLEDSKITLNVQNAEGFNDRAIKIYTITLSKESHTNYFLQFLVGKLSEEQKRLLTSQAESRLDANNDFFIRIDKDSWLKEREMLLTDSGHCFHIKLSLAAFPKNRQNALKLAEKLFSVENM